MSNKIQLILSYLLFSLKKCKTVIIVKNRNSPSGGLIRKGGLFRKNDLTPGGLIERGSIRNWGLIRSFTVMITDVERNQLIIIYFIISWGVI